MNNLRDPDKIENNTEYSKINKQKKLIQYEQEKHK